METAEPFRSFTPKDFFKKRFSPLVATFIDPDADQIVKQCGFSFVDVVAATAAQLQNPIRIVPAERIMPVRQEDFFSKVAQDMTTFGQSFVFPEFEQKDEVKTDLVPSYNAFKDHLHYPSFESSFPPWYKHMVESLCKSLRYSEFDFFDLPQCVLYVITTGSQTMNADELRKLLNFPDWMKEFLSAIPIVKVIVYDTLVVSEPSKELTQSRGSFEAVIGFPFRSRRINAPGGPDMIYLRNLFRFDGNVLNNPNLGKFTQDIDFQNVKKAVTRIEEIVRQYINRTISARTFEIEEQNKFANSFKSFFSRNSAPERVTKVLSIPWKKIIYSQTAALFLIQGKYVEAQKYYKLFAAQIESMNLHFIRLSALFIAAILDTVIPNQLKDMPPLITDIINNINKSNNLRFIMYVPILTFEMYAAIGDGATALKLCKKTIDKVRQLWVGASQSKILFTALLNERLAGLTREDRASWLLTSRSLVLYKQCNQIPHSLRCAIWLLKVLPKNWPLLYQNVWLDKATLLCFLKQGARSLNECKELLALPNLSPFLHEKAISQFFAPYNDPAMNKSLLNIKINSLLEVKSLRMIDPSVPEYYNFNSDEFSVLVREVNAWHSLKRDRSYTKSFQSWNDDLCTAGEVKFVGTEQPIYFIISLYNRYKFTVHLDHSVLIADYKGDATENPIDLESVKDKDIKGFTKKCTEIKYTCVPHAPGHFAIHKFKKNYWGYVDTEVDCGPIVFNCVAKHPKVDVSIEDLPNEVIAWQCIKFNVVVENKGDSQISEFSVVFDHPRSIVAAIGTENLGEVSVITVKGELNPGEKKKVPLIFRAAKLDKNTFHFCVSINNFTVGYARAAVNVVQAAHISARAFNRPSDTCGHAVAFTITPRIDGIRIFGFMNRRGHLVRTLKLNKNALPSGCPQTFVIFPDEEDEETVESWRAEIMGQAPIAVLFSLGEGEQLYAQKNITYDSVQKSLRVKIDGPSHIEIPEEGGKFTVTISCNPQEKPFVIEPAPFKFVTKHDQSVASPCYWVGITRATLSEENGFKAQFTAYALRNGIYKIPFVYIPKENGFKDIVNVSQTFYVSMK